jgi:hypothetical protein
VPFGGSEPNTSVIQTGIDTSGGDNAGRDINNLTVNVPAAPPTKLAVLLKAFKAEQPGDKTLQEHIKQLQVFTRVVENETVIGLDGKFEAANRSDQLDMALHLKEMIYAELQQNCFSPAFQRLYAYLLGEIWSLFDAYARPLILAGEDRKVVDATIEDRVIAPMATLAAECGEDNDLSRPFFRGLLYYLTGNCHVKWH